VEQSDLTLRRYGAAVRRLWLVIAIPAAALALAFGVGAGEPIGNENVTEVRLAVADTSDLFGSVVPSPPAGAVSFRGFVDLLASSQTADLVSAATGVDADVTVRGVEEGRTVIISARTASADEAAAVADAYVEFAAQARQEDLTSVAASARRVLDAERDALTAQVQSLDGQLAESPDGAARAALTDALQAERNELVERLVEIDTAEGVLDELDDGGIPAVQVLDRDARTSGGVTSTLYRWVIGAIVGAVLGLVAVVIYTTFTRRIRTVADVEVVTGEGSVLGVLNTGGEVPALLIDAMVRRDRSSPLVVVGTPGTTPESLASAINAHGGAASTMSSQDGMIEGVQTAQREVEAAVVMVGAGTTTFDELGTMVRLLEIANLSVVGVVVQRPT
jgi:hypothetical protein